MLRLRYLLRSPHTRPSLFSRTSAQSNLSSRQNVQHVRFRRPWLRSFITKCLLYGTAFHLWSTFVLIRFDDDIDDGELSTATAGTEVATHQTSKQSDESPKGEVSNEDAVFIPLAWSRSPQGELYTKKDPEFQEFIKIIKDKTKLKQIRSELVTIIFNGAGRQISQVLGTPFAITDIRLAYQFPDRAPPGYVRSGVEITGESVSWVTKPMDPEIGDRLQTFMKPAHVAKAIRDAYLVLFMRQLGRFKKPAGESLDGSGILNNQSPVSGSKRGGWVSQEDQSQLQPQLSDKFKENMHPNTEISNYHPSSLISLLQRLPLPDLGPGSDLHLASQAFKLRLNRERARVPTSARRGVFTIAGHLGMKGPDGFCRVEVRGEYDPAMPGWRTVEISLGDMNIELQRAGGS